MNERHTKGKEPRKKGFYAALYSCVGVLLATAVVIGYTNLNRGDGTDAPGQNLSADSGAAAPDSAAVNSGTDQTMSEAIDEGLNRSAEDETTLFKKAAPSAAPSEQSPAVSPAPAATQPAAKPETSKATASPAPSGQPAPKADAAEDGNSEAAEEENSVDLTDISLETSDAFTAFEDDGLMEWPVLGEIVMDFSTDTLVYDKTLEQYRTNDTVCIAAPSGTQVRAAAEGVVADVLSSRELGNTVVVDHGNGWTTTYSQLQDNVLVSVGDVVKTGQIIGGVGEPSIYSALLGSHLGFVVAKDDVPVNPKDILAEN